MLEAATGAPVLFAASLPANTSGPQVRSNTCFAHSFTFAVKHLARYIAQMPFEIAFAKLRSSFCAGVISPSSLQNAIMSRCHFTISLLCVCGGGGSSETFNLGQMQILEAQFTKLVDPYLACLQQLLTMVICDMQLVRSYMDTAVANNLNVMRIWAQTVGFNRAPFQTSLGVYNENIFRGLDYTLDQARQRNLKARMLCFV